jgi:DNA-binding response OmpR family regulator
MRLLVIEDRHVMADSIARSLRREGMAVDVAYDGRAGLDLAAVNSYQVVILDRDLPGVHGDEVCRQLTGGQARILMLTASGTVEDRVDGLSLGADDYLPKPFALTELIARIRALGRRATPASPPVLTTGDLTLDPNRHLAERAGRPLALTNKELAVLEVLMAASGRVVSTEELLERVWDLHTDPFTNTVRVTLGNLRRKIGNPPLITTVIGAGYRLVRS